MATNNDLLTLLGNLQNVDAGGCPAPFIGEVLWPYKRGCKWNPPGVGYSDPTWRKIGGVMMMTRRRRRRESGKHLGQTPN